MSLELTLDAMAPLGDFLPPGIRGRVLNLADAHLLEAFRHEVTDRQLPDVNCYRLDAHAPDFPLSHLGPTGPGVKGLIGGLFADGDILIGYGALSLPQAGQPNRADILNLKDGGGDRIADLESAMVHNDWRGQGLHHALIQWRLALASALGRRHVVCAVWPGNHWSWMNLLDHHLLGKKLVQVRGGWLRLLTHRDLAQPLPVPDEATSLMLPLADLVEQGPLFDQGYWLWQGVRRDQGIYARLALPRWPEEAP